MSETTWRTCSSCKREIGFDTKYWICSVSTCNKKRTALFFCSVACWDAHLPGMRHRKAWAVEKRSPTREEYLASVAAEAAKEAPKPKTTTEGAQATIQPGKAKLETLVVVTKVLSYLEAHGLKAQKDLMTALSDRVRDLCESAAVRARANGRKTLLERDFTTPRGAPETEVLVVASRVKRYVKASVSLNTGNAVIPIISGHVALMLKKGIKTSSMSNHSFVGGDDLD